jgi:hypothetical protein
MNRETVQQIVKEDLGMRNISTKMMPRILTHEQKHWLHIGSLLVMKRGVFNTTKNKMTEHIVENTEFTSAEKSTRISVTGQDHACVFLRSQGDSSLRIHCTRTNGKSAVLLGSADQVTGICSEEKTWTLS